MRRRVEPGVGAESAQVQMQNAGPAVWKLTVAAHQLGRRFWAAVFGSGGALTGRAQLTLPRRHGTISLRRPRDNPATTGGLVKSPNAENPITCPEAAFCTIPDQVDQRSRDAANNLHGNSSYIA